MTLSWPAPLELVSDERGWRIHPITGVRTFHWGMDFGLPGGAAIRAADSGTVVWAGSNGGEGLSVHVDHGNGILTKYFHSRQLLVSRGDRVAKGQTLALVGSTGASTGNHLHFELWIDGVNQNPRDIMTGTAYVTGPTPSGGNSSPINEGDDMPDNATLEAIARDQERALWRDDPEMRRVVKALVSEAISDEVADLKNTIKAFLKVEVDTAVQTVNGAVDTLKSVVQRDTRARLYRVKGTGERFAFDNDTKTKFEIPDDATEASLKRLQLVGLKEIYVEVTPEDVGKFLSPETIVGGATTPAL